MNKINEKNININSNYYIQNLKRLFIKIIKDLNEFLIMIHFYKKENELRRNRKLKSEYIRKK